VRLDPLERALAATLVAVAALAHAADPPGTPRSNQALAVCDRAGDAPSKDAKAKLAAEGLALAEKAVAEDDGDPKAHFAVFCNLGKQMEARGAGLRSLGDVRRLHREVDRTLELAPEWSDALLGKGSLLLDVPRMLGGDPKEGERLVREALRVDPRYVSARLTLARALKDRGAKAEARSEAESARADAEKKGDAEAAARARALLGEL
jgi:tetratricopeptide (TPR) repeat protein